MSFGLRTKTSNLDSEHRARGEWISRNDTKILTPMGSGRQALERCGRVGFVAVFPCDALHSNIGGAKQVHIGSLRPSVHFHLLDPCLCILTCPGVSPQCMRGYIFIGSSDSPFLGSSKLNPAIFGTVRIPYSSV